MIGQVWYYHSVGGKEFLGRMIAIPYDSTKALWGIAWGIEAGLNQPNLAISAIEWAIATMTISRPAAIRPSRCFHRFEVIAPSREASIQMHLPHSEPLKIARSHGESVKSKTARTGLLSKCQCCHVLMCGGIAIAIVCFSHG